MIDFSKLLWQVDSAWQYVNPESVANLQNTLYGVNTQMQKDIATTYSTFGSSMSKLLATKKNNTHLTDPCILIGEIDNYISQKMDYYLICEIKNIDDNAMQTSMANFLDGIYLTWVEEIKEKRNLPKIFFTTYQSPPLDTYSDIHSNSGEIVFQKMQTLQISPEEVALLDRNKRPYEGDLTNTI